jgi:hypothetical protein
MSIEVRCPSPTCGKVHRVKNKYAGMRGKCPDCGTWMPIPRLASPVPASAPGPAPAPAPEPVPPVRPGLTAEETALWVEPEPQPEEAPRPAAGRHRPPDEDEATVVEAPRPGRARPRPAEDQDITLEEEPEERPTKAAKAAPGRQPRRPEPEEDEEAIEVAEEDVEEDEPRKAKRRFSWFVVVLLFLGSLCVGAGGVVPWLDDPSAKATGPMQTSPYMRQRLPWIDEPYRLYATLVPAGVALLAIVGMMVSMATRNFGIVPKLTTYLAVLTSVAGLTLALTQVLSVQYVFARMDKEAQRLGEIEKVELKTSFGVGAPVALGGAGGAILLLSVALMLMHRRAFPRILYVVLLLAALVAGSLVVFSQADLPPRLAGLLGTGK